MDGLVEAAHGCARKPATLSPPGSQNTSYLHPKVETNVKFFGRNSLNAFLWMQLLGRNSFLLLGVPLLNAMFSAELKRHSQKRQPIGRPSSSLFG
jgi:hypothetical protein